MVLEEELGEDSGARGAERHLPNALAQLRRLLVREREQREMLRTAVEEMVRASKASSALVKELLSALQAMEAKVKDAEITIEQSERASVERERRFSLNLESVLQPKSEGDPMMTKSSIELCALSRRSGKDEDKLDETVRELLRLKADNMRLLKLNDDHQQTLLELERKRNNSEQELVLALHERSRLEKFVAALEEKVREQQDEFEKEKWRLEIVLRSQKEALEKSMSHRNESPGQRIGRSMTSNDSGERSPPQKSGSLSQHRLSLLSSARERSVLQARIDELNALVDRLSRDKEELRRSIAVLSRPSEKPPQCDKSVETEVNPQPEASSQLAAELEAVKRRMRALEEKLQSMTSRPSFARDETDENMARVREYENSFRSRNGDFDRYF